MTSYNYDDSYQLTYVDYPSGSDFGYQYDAVGNRTKMYEYTASTITTNYVYDNADELTQWTTSTVTMTFTYASDGCLKTKSDGTDTWTYDWDYERHLKAFKKNSATLVEYGYNPTGTRRYSSDSTLGLTNYFHHGLQPVAEFDGNWSLEVSHVLGPGVDEVIGSVNRTTDPNTCLYLVKDGLGSIRELLTSAQTAATRYDYDVWGKRSEVQLSGSATTPYGSSGWPCGRGSVSLLDGFVYDPAIGRFLLQHVTPRCMDPRENPYSLPLNQPMAGHKAFKRICLDRSLSISYFVQIGITLNGPPGFDSCSTGNSCTAAFNTCDGLCYHGPNGATECKFTGEPWCCHNCCMCRKDKCNFILNAFGIDDAPRWGDKGCYNICCERHSNGAVMKQDGALCECSCLEWSDKWWCKDWWDATWCLRSRVTGAAHLVKLGGTIYPDFAWLECEYDRCVNFRSGRQVGDGQRHSSVIFPARLLRGVFSREDVDSQCPCWRKYVNN